MNQETLERMLVKCAEMDGYSDVYIKEGLLIGRIKPLTHDIIRKAYSTSHDALQPLLDAMDNSQYAKFMINMCEMQSLVFKATCEQKFRAYCMAMGWMKEEKQ